MPTRKTLGSFCWYTIPEEAVSLATLRRHVKACGLDLDRFPKARRPEHVAQEACRSVETANGAQVRTEMLLRNPAGMVYQISRSAPNYEQRIVEHTPILRVTFKVKDATLKFESLGADVGGLDDLIRDHYETNSTRAPGTKVRTIIRHYIEDSGGESVRGHSGGTYFMPPDGAEFLAKIKALLDALYGPGQMHIVPCPNDEEQRAYLQQRFVANCSEDLKEFRERLLDLLRNQNGRKRGFRRDMVANVVEERKRIDSRRAKFSEILDDELEALYKHAMAADKALAKFLAEVEPVEVAA